MYKPESEKSYLSQNLKLFCSNNNLSYAEAAALFGVRPTAFLNWIGQRSLPVDEDKKALEKIFKASYKQICSASINTRLLLDHPYCVEDIYPYNVLISATIDFRYIGTDAVEHYETNPDVELPFTYRQLTLEEAENIITNVLTNREAMVIRARYQESLTLEATGMRLGVTRERIRQIEHKALRKICISANRVLSKRDEDERLLNRLIVENRELRNQLNLRDGLPLRTETLDTTLKELCFSVRTYNCLKRRGINTLYDIVTYDKELSHIRNLGQHSVEEIIRTVKDYTSYYKYDENLHHFIPVPSEG